jgi:acetyltransferase-like isoleucine patch superfamily enzyme
MTRWRKAWFMLLELGLRVALNPYMRSRLLRIFGAAMGNNVRIYEVQFFNLEKGFKNFRVEDDVHIGLGCRIDLEGPVTIRRGTAISPGVTILTHSDPGSQHDTPLSQAFAPFVRGVEIGPHCWIGCNSTILAGALIRDRTVIGACSLVIGELEPDSLYLGTPARKVRSLTLGDKKVQ